MLISWLLATKLNMETRYQTKLIVPSNMWFENAYKLKCRPQHYKYQLGSRQNKDGNKSIMWMRIFIPTAVMAPTLQIYTSWFTHKNNLSKFLTMVWKAESHSAECT